MVVIEKISRTDTLDRMLNYIREQRTILSLEIQEKQLRLAEMDKIIDSVNIIEIKTVPEEKTHRVPGKNYTLIQRLEKELIERVLADNSFNRKVSAHVIGMCERTLHRRINDYNIKTPKPLPT